MVDFSGRFPPITSQASKVIPLRPFLFTTITSATCDNCDNCDKQHTFCTMTWFGAQHLFYHCSCYPSPTFFPSTFGSPEGLPWVCLGDLAPAEGPAFPLCGGGAALAESSSPQHHSIRDASWPGLVFHPHSIDSTTILLTTTTTTTRIYASLRHHSYTKFCTYC